MKTLVDEAFWILGGPRIDDQRHQGTALIGVL